MFRVTPTRIAVALLGALALYFGFAIHPSLYEILTAPGFSVRAYVQKP
jgi:hypothetical protein